MTAPLTIAFVITNDRHHTAMLEPVARAFARRGDRCRVLSLCELRGFASPARGAWGQGVEIVRAVTPLFRRSPATGAGGAGRSGARSLARDLVWRLLEPRVRRALARDTDAAVLPNDAAYPYDRIVGMLRDGPPFVLVQEGIRFETPADLGAVYGGGGAAAVAAWGEGSAAYFRSVGVAAERIRPTGSPRFDGVLAEDWAGKGRDLGARLGLGRRNLLLLSNPIDDLGFCSTDDKLDLLRRFAAGISPLFSDPAFHLTIKLHARESEAATRSAVADLPHASRITVVRDAPLYPLFAVSAGAVILASTTGLEALLFGLPLGVLEIPGVGHVHDYVTRGAAVGLLLERPLDRQVDAMLEPGEARRAAMGAYVDHHLAAVEGSAERVHEVVEEVARMRGSRRLESVRRTG